MCTDCISMPQITPLNACRWLVALPCYASLSTSSIWPYGWRTLLSHFDSVPWIGAEMWLCISVPGNHAMLIGGPRFHYLLSTGVPEHSRKQASVVPDRVPSLFSGSYCTGSWACKSGCSVSKANALWKKLLARNQCECSLKISFRISLCGICIESGRGFLVILTSPEHFFNVITSLTHSWSLTKHIVQLIWHFLSEFLKLNVGKGMKLWAYSATLWLKHKHHHSNSKSTSGK